MYVSDGGLSNLESISKGVDSLITGGIITNSDASPYTVLVDDTTGLTIFNTSGANALSFTLTFSDASTFVIPVAAGDTYKGAYDLSISTIAYTGTTPSFTAELLKRG